ncbi:MAG: hypothetical protein VX948_04650 [Candidatus Latescibacterota bacterium]|jgi:hypothetical protein|nr:hypothetical protein [Candidatus Latescibacterota bacterium]|tara:strand:+ start:2318 stop:2539 length:222 start_codon:yes stop_codon:yes gene_type:complete
MKTAAEKLRETMDKMIDNWMIEFDIDAFTVIGVLEDAKHSLIWGGTPNPENKIDAALDSIDDEDDEDDEEDDE